MPTNWKVLSDLCLELGFPEPEIRRKMWVTVVEIQDYFNTCHRDMEVATDNTIKWCRGYRKEQNELG